MGQLVGSPKLPAIRDDSGYVLTHNDFDFLGISYASVVSCFNKQLPLGMSAPRYQTFIDQLLLALKLEGVETKDVDVRIQGSSVNFFSNRTKKMPYSKEAILAEYITDFGNQPLEDMPIPDIELALSEQWPANAPRPLRRPFDSLFRLGIAAEPSDYDVQISSDSLVRIIENKLGELGVNPDLFEYRNPNYAFVMKKLVTHNLRHLSDWADNMSQVLCRPVSIALFNSVGPPVVKPTESNIDPVSSHFKKEDWKVVLPDNR